MDSPSQKASWHHVYTYSLRKIQNWEGAVSYTQIYIAVLFIIRQNWKQST